MRQVVGESWLCNIVRKVLEALTRLQFKTLKYPRIGVCTESKVWDDDASVRSLGARDLR